MTTTLQTIVRFMLQAVPGAIIALLFALPLSAFALGGGVCYDVFYFTVSCGEESPGGGGGGGGGGPPPPPPVSTAVNVSPSSIYSGEGVTLSYSQDNAYQCTSTNFNLTTYDYYAMQQAYNQETPEIPPFCFTEGGVEYCDGGTPAGSGQYYTIEELQQMYPENHVICSYDNNPCNGSQTLYPTGNTTYSMSCTNSYTTDNDSDSVTVLPAPVADVYAGTTGAVTVTAGSPATFNSTVYNQGDATASNFPNVFQINGVGYVAAETRTVTAGGSSAISSSYTFASAGSYSVRACADLNTSGAGAISESNESNNCGSWATVTVNSPLPSAPSGLSATCNTAGTSINFSWNAVSGATSYYFRNDDQQISSCGSWYCQDPPDTATAPITQTTYTVNGIVPGHTNSWWVHSNNASGYSGATYSSIVCAAPPAPTCSNGLDDDGDGATDYPADTGCTSTTDTTDGPNLPTASLSAAPTTISSGDSSVLTWGSTGSATSCTGTGFTAGGASGTRSVSPTTSGVNTYSVYCSNSAGNSSTAYASVTVVTPSATISAAPTLVDGRGSGGSATLTWSAVDATTCDIARSQGTPSAVVTDAVPSGTMTTVVSGITRQTRFTLTCDTLAGGTASGSVMVNVIPTEGEF